MLLSRYVAMCKFSISKALNFTVMSTFCLANFFSSFSRLFFSVILTEMGMDHEKCTQMIFVWSIALGSFQEASPKALK